MFYPSLVAFVAASTLGLEQPRFVVQHIESSPGQVHGMAIGDVDGDGRPDIILVDSTQVSWYRNGDWKRFVMLNAPSGKAITALAVRDLDGDGRVEIAVGADSLHFLIPPADPTQPWTPMPIDGARGARSMHWIDVGDAMYQLVVLPDHVMGNDSIPFADLFAYEMRNDLTTPWPRRTIRQPMPQAHYLSAHTLAGREMLYVSGNQGIVGFSFKDGRWIRHAADWLARGRPIQAAQVGHVASRNTHVLATIEPPNGSLATLYSPRLTDSLLVHDQIGRVILDRNMNDGRGLRMADLLGIGRDQAVIGWRTPNARGQFGIKLYVPFNRYWEAIDVYWIDYKGMACRGLDVADLDGDGRLDIVAYGGEGDTALKIYWNRSE